MTTFAIGLVLTSAFLHATWNLLTKRTSGGQAFVWLISLFSGIFLFPIAAYLLIVRHAHIGWEGALYVCLTGFLHTLYYLALNQAYVVGDMSLVYPLARGGAPVLSIIGAVLLFGERPTPIAIIGVALITIGTFILVGNFSGSGTSFAAILYGLLTATIVAAYTLSDKQAVGNLMVSPLLLIFVSSLIRSVALLPLAMKRRDDVKRIWRVHRRAMLSVALLDPLSYALFLMALAVSQVSYVAPARQSSVLIGAFLGVRVLSEGNARQRLIAAGVMMAGLAALAFG